MKLLRGLTIVLSLLIPALMVQAQPVTETRAALAGARFGSSSSTTASFAAGLLRAQDTAFRSEAYAGDTIIVSGNIRPEAQDAGKPADVFAVMRLGTAFYMINETGKLEPWNGIVSALVPRLPM